MSAYRNSGYHVQKYALSATGSWNWLVYSKNETSLPITTLKVESQPCLDPKQQSNNYDKAFYIAEVMQSTCKPEYNTGLVFDDRFTEFKAWATDEYTVQKDNGVFSALSSLADYSSYVQSPDIKK